MLLAIKNRVVCLCIIQVHGIVHLYVYIHNMVKTIANMANITLLWFIFGQKCAIISKINFLNKTFYALSSFLYNAKYFSWNRFHELFFFVKLISRNFSMLKNIILFLGLYPGFSKRCVHSDQCLWICALYGTHNRNCNFYNSHIDSWSR